MIDNPNSINSVLPVEDNEKREVITIIQATIRQFRQLEDTLKVFGIKSDELRFRNKIGGLYKVMHYLEKINTNV